MRKSNSFIFIFLSFVTLILAGCGEDPDCSSNNTDYAKYTWDKESKECKLTTKLEKNVCGNSVIEDDENYCNCPNDVFKEHPELGCDGSIGEYLDNTCVNNRECVMTQNDKVISQIKSIDLKNSDVHFRADFTINSPYILNTDDENLVEVDIELFKFISTTNNIINIEVKELIVENSASINFATIDYNQAIASTPGTILRSKEFPLSQTDRYEKKESLKVELVVSYTKETISSSSGEVIKSEDKVESLKGSLGSWTIINPNFYEE